MAIDFRFSEDVGSHEGGGRDHIWIGVEFFLQNKGAEMAFIRR